MQIPEWINEKWCLYKHTAPNGKVYIGITNNTKNRWRTNGIGYRSQTVFWRAIQKYGWNNFKHEILLTGLDLETAKQKEIELIAQYKSNQKDYGYNMTSGGDNLGKNSHTPEAIAKALATKKAKLAQGIHPANYGRKASPELRAKLSKAHIGLNAGEKHPMYGKHHSEEVKEKLRKANLGKKHTEEEITKIRMGAKNNKPVLQFTLDGKFVKKWHSIMDATRGMGKSSSSSITDCCHGKLKKGYGFIWRFEDDYISPISVQ